MFSAAQLQDLANLPRWHSDGDTGDELEPDRYVACVGYTAYTFPAGGKDTNQPATPAVMFNVMFVLILGLTM